MPKKPRRKSNLNKSLSRGLIRNIVVLVDASREMSQQDYSVGGSGNRLVSVLKYLKDWIASFFDLNPLGSIQVLGMRDGLAERLLSVLT